MDGIYYIDKQEGWTSRDVDNKIEKLFHAKKVGHAGTLDPFATGLLVVGVGKATKALTFFHDDNKEYEATLILGAKTVSGDKTSFVTETMEIPPFDEEKIKTVFASFLGRHKQIPPMMSAVHYQGRKLYELAREGKEVEREEREIEISSLSLISYTDNSITFKCMVSKGTYIRTLGEEIAEKLGTLGYLSSLRRLSIENISVDQAKMIDQIREKDAVSIASALSFLPRITVDEIEANRIKSGVERNIRDIEPVPYILYVNSSSDAIAVYEHKEGNLYVSKRGLF